MNSFLRQESFLNKILNELNDSPCDKLSDVEIKLNELRNELLTEKQIRFYMCADLNKLTESAGHSLDKVWLENFSDASLFNQKSVFTTNEPFKVDLTWHLKKGLNLTDSLKTKHIYSPSPKHDYIINLGSTESSYLRLISSCDILSYDSPNYAGLLVLIEYFTQTEVKLLNFNFKKL